MAGDFHKVEIELDATATTGWHEPIHTSAFVVAPDSRALRSPVTVLFAFPGGTHEKSYYDMHIPALDGYSMAEFFARRGYVFVGCDPLGVGGSSPIGTDERVTRKLFVDANRATVDGVLHHVQSGSALGSRKEVEVGEALGLGTSMGGMLLIEQQADHGSFHGVVVMGYSGIQTRLATPPPDWSPPTRFADVDNPQLFYTLYWDDVPEQVIAADQALKVPAPLGAVRAGGGYRGAMDPGAVAEKAAKIDVPVLVAVGERDVCPDPHAEVTAYRASNDVALFRLPRAGHAPCVAGTRELLWRRIESWADRLSEEA